MAELNIRQERFLRALIEAPTIEKACEQAEITRQTGYKYLKDESFLFEYRKLRREAMQQVTARLQNVSIEAVDVLRRVMNDDEASPSARVQSARAVLENAYKGIELDDIAERLEQVEGYINDKK